MSTKPCAEICFGVENGNQSLSHNLSGLKFKHLELQQRLIGFAGNVLEKL